MKRDELQQAVNALALKPSIEAALAGLACQRRATVLRMRLGICGYRPMSLQQVGDRLGISRQRARDLEYSGLRRLKRESQVEQSLSCVQGQA